MMKSRTTIKVPQLNHSAQSAHFNGSHTPKLHTTIHLVLMYPTRTKKDFLIVLIIHNLSRCPAHRNGIMVNKEFTTTLLPKALNLVLHMITVSQK